MTTESLTAIDSLRSLADLIDSGLPLPICAGINICSGRLTVQVLGDDLTEWLTVLEAVEPTWMTVKNADHAEWPEGEFDDKPFALACCITLVRAL